MPADRPLRGAAARALLGGWRLFTLRRAERADFEPRPELFAFLFVLDLVALFVFAVAAVGLKGEVNLYELPRAFMFVPLALAVGLLAARLERSHAGADRDGEILRLPVALAAAGLLFTVVTSGMYLLAQRQWLPFTEAYWWYFDQLSLGWSALVVLNAAGRVLEASLVRRAAVGVAGIALLVLPSWWLPIGLIWMPRYDEGSYAGASFHTLAAESAFYAQRDLLERELAQIEPGRPGVPEIYLVAAALYAGEDVFMKEVDMITNLFRERFDAAGRTVQLVNNPKTVDSRPIASLTSLRETLAAVGESMNTDEDVLVLYVSSHGSDKHELTVDFRPIRFTPVTPDALKSALAESGIRWKVVIVSACYSGGFVNALKDDTTLVITAASAERQSFGCGATSDATYLAQALFGHAMKDTFSFEKGFESARGLIQTWEQEKKYTASEPQIHAGAAIRAKLAEIERRLAAGAARPR